ncbi:hypothetical protein AMS68_000852 [Peltaster fructicola]|uniref:Uncharacterized protein n=1 Tax=Peltaster fructicola TaxID=286661 RepID=A0A6H0XL35_9PEZI|nr:hypothetical protein AMS68_000852 [Peltaster fructicola]
MKKSFSARRVPRKIGSDDESTTPSDLNVVTSSIKRPTVKPKRSSQLQSFGTDQDGDDSSGGSVIAPKRSNISRIALQRSAGQRSSFLSNELPRNPNREEDIPTYSTADLQALKDSTPSTPQQSASEANLHTTLGVRDKFGTSLARYEQQQNAAIPSATQIAEKKARRARLALEAKADEYISLDPDDPGWQEDEDGNVMRDMDGRLVLREKDKYKVQESRLVRDDEDVMEGFDEYTGETGSRIAMGASTLPNDQQARRNDISAQIAYAEGGSDSDSDVEEKTRNAAFEAAQTKHGAYGASIATTDPYAEHRVKTPPVITPLPDMESVLRRLRKTLLDMEEKKRAKEAEMDLLTKEKFRIRNEETRVQMQLKEVAEKFRQLKMERGFLPKDQPDIVTTVAEVSHTDDDDHDEDMLDRPRLGLGHVS